MQTHMKRMLAIRYKTGYKVIDTEHEWFQTITILLIGIANSIK